MSKPPKVLKVVKPKYYKILKRLHPQLSPSEIAHVNLRLTVVDEMNESLVDSRLDDLGGVMDAMEELADYFFYLKSPRIMVANVAKRDGKELVFFEV